MVKSDKHMEKVRARLLSIKDDKEKRDVARNLREQKKNALKVLLLILSYYPALK